VRRLALVVGTLALAAPASAASPPLSVTTSLTPARSLFGDVVTATAVVRVDPDRVDPGSVRVEADFVPLVQAGAPTRAGLVFRFRISCLSAACVPGPDGRRVELPALVVRARLRRGGPTVARASWPVLSLTPRVGRRALTESPLGWRKQTDPAPVSYRAEPATLLALLAAGVCVLAAAGLGIVAWELARRRRLNRPAPEPGSALARAIALARESMRRDPNDRRKALALLARLLAGRADRLAGTATSLAWSRARPEPEPIGALADAVEREVAAP
jgi:hypothetical protein